MVCILNMVHFGPDTVLIGACLVARATDMWLDERLYIWREIIFTLPRNLFNYHTQNFVVVVDKRTPYSGKYKAIQFKFWGTTHFGYIYWGANGCMDVLTKVGCAQLVDFVTM